LLSSEAHRPPWNVAGVDYAVGTPSGTTLKDPSTISLSGVSVDKVGHYVTVTGNDVVVSGYDFSLGGGWGVQVTGGSGAVIKNNNFVVGSNHIGPIYVASSATNVTIESNVIDGQGAGGGAGTQILVGSDGMGTTTIQYNVIENAWGQNIVQSSDVGGENWIIRYNVIQNGGLGFNQGAHGDWIQQYNAPGKNTASVICNFNLFAQTVPIATGRTQGISAFSANSGPDSGGVQTEAIDNNTFVTTPGSYVNFAIILDTKRLIGTGEVKANYLDLSGIGTSNGGGGNWALIGAYNGSQDGPYSGTVTASGNVNMATGATLQ
jgi:hypothetical protein